ncbi:PaaI family thioesterase [Celeribacter neptunius]|nr:PaaI family thioesterase [Celeribacter neptunius]
MEQIGPLMSARNELGGFVYALQTTKDHSNALGLVHGGVITSLLDQAIALEAWNAADRAPCVTVQLDTRFVSASKPGARLQARATVRETTGSLMFLDAEVLDGVQVIALATAVMKISRKAA